MKIKVGTDLINITRFKNALNKIQDRVFLPSELKNLEIQHLAGIFAAKEAVIKALNLKPGVWHNIEISNKKSGKPVVKLSEDLIKNKIINYDLSISHDNKYSIATFVVLLE